ncbi:MAG TPA: hypothetical protein VHQ98_12005 [Gaiellaceae bacterium]|nr:hypothetical protein [Gaiellaceae bacterium]
MKAIGMGVAVVLAALAIAPAAFADGSGGSGGAQAGVQSATTAQGALGAALSHQNAVNANVPVSIAGGNVTSGPSSATQTATSNATTDVSNEAETEQSQKLDQNFGCGCDRKKDGKEGRDSGSAGSGGAGGFQAGVQKADTNQAAIGVAKSKQNAVNANVPVSIAGGNITGGSSNATQTANSNATTDVSNESETEQKQKLDQDLGGSSCHAGCGGAGGFQVGVQKADTNQAAIGVAKSDQNAVNANVPVSIAGGNISGGSSNATQNADSNATTNVENESETEQKQKLDQDLGGSSCYAGCGGAGGFQVGVQKADTDQFALGVAKSDQNAVNANVPVSIAGGDITSGDSNATQTANSNATTDVSNESETEQSQKLDQDFGCGCNHKKDGKDSRDSKDGKDGCYAGCGGAGGFQLGIQKADTEQAAIGIAKSDQNAVNGNAPVEIAGGDITSGDSNATQTVDSNATTDVSNESETEQNQKLDQDFGCGCDKKKDGKDGRDSKDGKGHDDGCQAGCGGPGGFQVGIQKAETNQLALGVAKSDQNAVNGNAPVEIAGGDITSGDSNATQTANSNATANVENESETEQNQKLDQDFGSSSCKAGCGGAGGFQVGVQKAETNQLALGVAKSDQNAVNGNAPVEIAGGDITSGDSNATQTANSNATTDVSNEAETEQKQKLDQDFGCGCDHNKKDRKDGKNGYDGGSAGSGGAGGFQLGIQNAETNQLAAGIAKSDQNAVNSNAPHAIAGYDITGGSSNATQTADSNATANVENEAETEQHQKLDQDFGCGCDRKHDGKGSRRGNTPADNSSEDSSPENNGKGEERTSPNKVQRQED